MRGETYDVLNVDVLIELALVLVVFECEGGKDEVAWVELQKGRVADEVADVGVFVFASKFLKDDLTLVEGCAVLFGNSEWSTLVDYFEECFHFRMF